MNEMEAFLEQLAAAQHVAYHYTCIVCQNKPGVTPTIIIEDLPEGGCRAVIVVVCEDCTLTNKVARDIVM